MKRKRKKMRNPNIVGKVTVFMGDGESRMPRLAQSKGGVVMDERDIENGMSRLPEHRPKAELKGFSQEDWDEGGEK